MYPLGNQEVHLKIREPTEGHFCKWVKEHPDYCSQLNPYSSAYRYLGPLKVFSDVYSVYISGIEPLHIGKMPKFPKKVIRRQKVSSARFPLKQSVEEKDENKEYLRYRNSFLKLKGVFKPAPLFHTQKTSVSNQSFRYRPRLSQ